MFCMPQHLIDHEDDFFNRNVRVQGGTSVRTGGEFRADLYRCSGNRLGLSIIESSPHAGCTDVEGEDQFQTVQVLASIPQGRQLRDDASVLDWRPNHKFKGKLILASGKSKPVTLDGDLKVTVVGPLEPHGAASSK